MARKNVYTSRDIEELSGKGVTTLEVGEDDIVTEICRETAERVGISLTFGARRPIASFSRSDGAPQPGGIKGTLIREMAKLVEGASSPPARQADSEQKPRYEPSGAVADDPE